MTLTSHNIAETTNIPTSSPPVERSDWLDVLGGIVLPVVCIVLDPFVFRTAEALPGGGGPLLGRYLVFGYGEILLGMFAFVLYRWRRALSPFLAGMLLMGAIFAGLLGLVLLPFSVIGVMVMIGLLGFSPFVSSFVFARAYMRLHRLCLEKQSKTRVVQMTLLGLLFALFVPIGTQVAVDAAVDPAIRRILAGDTSVEARRALRRFAWATNLDVLVNTYREEKDVSKKEALAEAYREITGDDIEDRLRILDD
jgi:hypothetical protein